jgi:predicted RNase H-like HicB family nuclease
MNKIITFKISKGEDGFYIAAANDFAIFTQGKTFEDLVRNIREAVEVSVGDILGNKADSFPPVMMNMDFAEVSNA